MDKYLAALISKLKEDPKTSSVDHLAIIQDLSDDEELVVELKPLFDYFVNNRLDNMPAIRDKEVWSDEKFQEARKSFIDNFAELTKIVEKLLGE